MTLSKKTELKQTLSLAEVHAPAVTFALELTSTQFLIGFFFPYRKVYVPLYFNWSSDETYLQALHREFIFFLDFSLTLHQFENSSKIFLKIEISMNNIFELYSEKLEFNTNENLFFTNTIVI
jgi:hypothetical protein